MTVLGCQNDFCGREDIWKRAEKTAAKNYVTVALAEEVELARDYVRNAPQ